MISLYSTGDWSSVTSELVTSTQMSVHSSRKWEKGCPFGHRLGESGGTLTVIVDRCDSIYIFSKSRSTYSKYSIRQRRI